jgi:raffinose/stachyose/melibiose transport system substrate-binding protein
MRKSFNCKYLVILLGFIFLTGITGCTNKGNKNATAKEEKKKLKICVDVKDKHTVNIIKFMIDEYKKEDKDLEIDITNPLDSNKICDDISQGEGSDIIFTSRNSMLELEKKGLLGDLSNFYSKNKINDKFYNIMSAYGRVRDKYYGIGIIPYSIEVVYNRQAIEKLGTSPPKNITDFFQVLKKMNDSGTKLPVVLTEDIDIYNAFAAIFFSNLVELQRLENSYDSGMDSYKGIKEVQQVFDNINLLVKQGAVNREIVEQGSETTMSRLVKGDIPAMLTTSYYSKDIKDDKMGIVETYNISSLKEVIPVIINGLMCVPANSKNEEQVNNLMEFFFSDKIQKKLVEEGFITGNKEANKDLEGVKKTINEHIGKSNSNSIIYIYNFPKKFHPLFESKIMKVLSGKYNGNEWNEILEEAYK